MIIIDENDHYWGESLVNKKGCYWNVLVAVAEPTTKDYIDSIKFYNFVRKSSTYQTAGEIFWCLHRIGNKSNDYET